MVFDQLKQPALFGAPLSGLAVKEGYVNPSIEFIFVERFKALLKQSKYDAITHDQLESARL